MCAACVENGQSLAEKCEAGEPKTALERDISDLQAKWEKLEKLFGDLLVKLTEALVQVSLAMYIVAVALLAILRVTSTRRIKNVLISELGFQPGSQWLN